MSNLQTRAKVARQVVHATGLGILLCLAPLAQAGQHGGGVPHSAPAPHPAPQYHPPAQPKPRSAPPQYRPPQQPARPGRNMPAPQPGYYGQGARPAYNGSPYAMRPNPQAAGHLPQWMSQHQNMPAGQQERMLRQEPGFNRLSPGEQQRQIQQLHQLNQMSEGQRDRRLARAEALERLSPAQQAQVKQSSRDLVALPPDRQAVVRRAFQDLRGVPTEQRDTILNSARYNATFSPQERGILSNLLRIEPYDGPR